MNDTSTGSVPAGRVVRSGLATIAGWYAGLIVVFLVLLSLTPTEKADGRCDGIGFGCTPNPRDGLLLIGYIVGIPFALGSFVVAVITFGVIMRRYRSGLAAGTVSVLIGFFVAAAVPMAATLFL